MDGLWQIHPTVQEKALFTPVWHLSHNLNSDVYLVSIHFQDFLIMDKSVFLKSSLEDKAVTNELPPTAIYHKRDF